MSQRAEIRVKTNLETPEDEHRIGLLIWQLYWKQVRAYIGECAELTAEQRQSVYDQAYNLLP